MTRLAITLIIAATTIVLCTSTVHAQNSDSEWILEAFGGTAWNLDTHIDIEQDGFDNLSFTADFDTGGTGAPYYVWRIGRWSGTRAWEFEHIHHKLELQNNPPEVQDFQISHGYNMFTLNKAWEASGIIYRYGGGIVITHPESTVRDQEFNGDGLGGGYHLSGISAQFAVEKRFRLSDQFFAAAETKLTAAYARVPIENGHANVPNIALHALIGIGCQF